MKSFRAPQGFVSISFAVEKGAEREAAYAHQLEQLRSLVEARTDAGAAPEVSEAPQSEAGELAPIESLEDDDARSRIERGKRKVLLRREREVLAHKVRSTLGKTLQITSPFRRS